MSQELETHLWLDPEKYSFPGVLRILLEAMKCHFGTEFSWISMNVQRGIPSECVFKSSDEQEIRGFFWQPPECIDCDDLQVTMYVTFSCWRQCGGEVERGGVPLAIILRGLRYGESLGIDRKNEGDIQLVLLKSLPFPDGVRRDVEEKLEKNTLAFIDLLNVVSRSLPVTRQTTWVDPGSPSHPVIEVLSADLVRRECVFDGSQSEMCATRMEIPASGGMSFEFDDFIRQPLEGLRSVVGAEIFNRIVEEQGFASPTGLLSSWHGKDGFLVDYFLHREPGESQVSLVLVSCGEFQPCRYMVHVEGIWSMEGWVI